MNSGLVHSLHVSDFFGSSMNSAPGRQGPRARLQIGKAPGFTSQWCSSRGVHRCCIALMMMIIIIITIIITIIIIIIVVIFMMIIYYDDDDMLQTCLNGPHGRNTKCRYQRSNCGSPELSF